MWCHTVDSDNTIKEVSGEGKVMKTRIDLGIISKHRLALMGIAAIMILLCHSVVAKVEMPAIAQKILVNGNLGVDIFLLLSGFGMHYSCQKIPNGGGTVYG